MRFASYPQGAPLEVERDKKHYAKTLRLTSEQLVRPLRLAGAKGLG